MINCGIQTVFIMLGRHCNLQCKYCLQHDVVNDVLPLKPSEDLINFLVELSNQPNGLQVHFYGGEPLVYWETIKNMIKKLNEKTDNIRYTTITNGKLIDAEKAKYINKYFSGITISWDGRNSNITRGYDVVKDNFDNLNLLNGFTLSGVLSKYNYPLDFFADFNDAVKKFGKDTIGINIDSLLDVNMQNEDLKDFDFDTISEQMNILCNKYYDFIINNKDIMPNEFNYINIYINQLKWTINDIDTLGKLNKCGNGYNTWNIDLEGNVYVCHNTENKIGNINMSIIDIVKNAVRADVTTSNNQKCKECPVQILCHNGCPLVLDDARNDYYCKQEIALYQPIIDLELRLG